MAEKQYCGIGKVRIIGEGDNSYQILKVSLSPGHIKTITNWARDNNGWVTLDISKRKTPSDKGITHTVALDTWKKPTDNYTQDNVEKLKDTFNGTEEPKIDGVPF